MIRGALLLAAACTTEVSGAERGQELFESPSLSPSDLNIFSCATCHSAEEAPLDAGHPGYPLVGAAGRTAFWGEDYDTLREAVDACLVFFMKAEPLVPDSEDFSALFEYLVSIAPEGAPVEGLPFTVIENVADVERGDAGRGQEVYQQSCRRCHGEAFSAEGSILRETVNLPGVTDEYPSLFPAVDPSLVVIEKVRHGRFFNIGGDMPFFTLEALSDADLAALLSYLEL